MPKKREVRVWISRDGTKDNVYFYIDTRRPNGADEIFDWRGMRIGECSEFIIKRVGRSNK
jgi:hypothetical protein